MKFISTRGQSPALSLFDAVLAGIAPDGGLYVPQNYPTIPQSLYSSNQNYLETATEIFKLYCNDDNQIELVTNAAKEGLDQFFHPAIAPLNQLDHRFHLLELFHGPTRAFKDFAMQFAARLIDKILQQKEQSLLLLTATSGDTGAAAVHGFADAKNVKLIVFHPHEKVSTVQRKQMTTKNANNVLNIALKSDFDHCQTAVKTMLTHSDLKKKCAMSSVNSINFARLLGQIPYYVTTIATLNGGSSDVNFCVPTGNLGDAFAGWIARKMCAPVGKIVAAVNENDALLRFLSEGQIEKRTTKETMSVSMDVQAPSNFERLYFEASDRNAKSCTTLFSAFEQSGRSAFSQEDLKSLNEEILVEKVTEKQTEAQIRDSYTHHNKILCPHSAVAVSAAQRHLTSDSAPWVALATAHPAKFPQSISHCLGLDPQTPIDMAHTDLDNEKFEVMDFDLNAIESRLTDFVER